MKLMGTRPQSVAFGLWDSPVGLAAFIYALFQDMSDSGGNPDAVFSLDEIIDDIMLEAVQMVLAQAELLLEEISSGHGT
jgi:epoxide hydrolase